MFTRLEEVLGAKYLQDVLRKIAAEEGEGCEHLSKKNSYLGIHIPVTDSGVMQLSKSKIFCRIIHDEPCRTCHNGYTKTEKKIRKIMKQILG